jgi:probable phosphomutase (TIGR03848 family)
VTTLLLIRHGSCDPVGHSIAGRTPGVHLNALGLSQATALARSTERLPITAVYSSPLERARETAQPIAESRGLSVQLSPGLEELNYGDWTGRALESLRDDPLWQQFNQRRSATRIPNGETMAEVVRRARTAVSGIAAAHHNELVAAVTHGDVIRALLTSWAGMPLDHMLRLEVAPGSVSAIRLSPEFSLLALNWLPDPGAAL